jgi:hypothetical protein
MDIEFLKSIGITDDDLAAKVAEAHEKDVGGLKTKRDELLGKLTSQKEELAKYHEIDPDEYRTMAEKLSEMKDKDLMDKGEFEALIKKEREKHQNELDGAVSASKALDAQLNSLVVDSAVSQAIAEADGNPHILPALVKPFVKAVDVDGKRTLQILDDSGIARDGVGLGELLKEMRGDERYMAAFKGTGLSGGGAKQSSKQPSGDTDGMTARQKMASARPAAE